MTPVFVYFGGDNRDRTGDLSLAKAALSQLSYIPTNPFRLAASLVGLSGVEPLTSRLSGARSNHLSYRPETSRAAPETGVETKEFE